MKILVMALFFSNAVAADNSVQQFDDWSHDLNGNTIQTVNKGVTLQLSQNLEAYNGELRCQALMPLTVKYAPGSVKVPKSKHGGGWMYFKVDGTDVLVDNKPIRGQSGNDYLSEFGGLEQGPMAGMPMKEIREPKPEEVEHTVQPKEVKPLGPVEFKTVIFSTVIEPAFINGRVLEINLSDSAKPGQFEETFSLIGFNKAYDKMLSNCKAMEAQENTGSK